MLDRRSAAGMSSPGPEGNGVSGEERLRSLLQASRKLGAIRDPEELIRSLAREIRGLIAFDYLSLFLVDVTGEGPSWHILDVDHQSLLTPVDKVPLEETVESWVLEHQTGVNYPPRSGEPPFPGLEAILTTHGIASLCALPLTTKNCRVGTLIVASRRGGAYPEGEREFLSLVADQIALALDDAANFERLRVAQAGLTRSNESLRLLLGVGRSILSNLDLELVLRSVASNVRSALRCDVASVLVVEPGGTLGRVFVLDFPGSRGFAQEGKLIPVVGSALEEILRTGTPRDLARIGASDPGREMAQAEGLSTGWGFPLVSRGKALGVLTVARRGSDAFDDHELDIVGQIAGQVATALDNALAYREIAELRDRLAEEKLYLEDEIRNELSFDEIVGRSAALRRVLKEVETVAPTDSTVLIQGETGSGKELIARAIHERSARSGKTFVKLNCAAIPTGLLESELFGHQKGAFTGAIADRVGRFELAQRGTIFLDEIAEVPLELQPKLLRVLQEREFERLGSSRTLRTDARLLAATNRDLAAMVEAGMFRADLFYRLNVFPIQVPALRERSEDIPLLVRHFVQQLGRRMNKRVETIPAETMTLLTRYDWPGNIRELQNLIERAMIVTPGPVLRVPLDDLKAHLTPGAPAGRPRTLVEAERQHVLAALEESNWVLGGANGAAVRLGMNRSTLQFRLKKLGLFRPGN
jgi:formate hydrogenlyase transcriptional activator